MKISRILFMGTPDFAIPSLKALIERGYEICGAVTQPDKPRGRGHRLMPSPVKEFAQSNGISVFQPETLKNENFSDELKNLNPDIIIVAAYGKILPRYVLEFPKYGCINVHGSILPKYRGAAPIQRAVINGEKETGITTMLMNEGLDTGDILLCDRTEIGENETAGELFDRLAELGADTLLKTLDEIEKGTLKRTSQNNEDATYAHMLSRETGHIAWNMSADKIFSLVKGCNPYPVAYTAYKGETLKIFSCLKGEKSDAPNGKILGIKDKKLWISCENGSILADEIQFFGKKRMTVESYLNGHDIDLNETLI